MNDLKNLRFKVEEEDDKKKEGESEKNYLPYIVIGGVVLVALGVIVYKN